MRFHPQGYPTLFVTAGFTALIIVLSDFYASDIILNLAILLSVFLMIIVLQFFRDPKRAIPEVSSNAVLSPADGKVVVIEKAFEPEYLKEECWQISVFMSPLNVHINRNPLDGKVEYLKYHPGKYLAAWNPKSSTENERFTTVYNTGSGKILIRQIAGALARRIVNHLNEGEEVSKGKEMGFIKFGSRVDIFLPLNANIKVEMDQVVKSPGTILAEL